MPVGYSVSSEMRRALWRFLFTRRDLLTFFFFNYKADWKLKKFNTRDVTGKRLLKMYGAACEILD